MFAVDDILISDEVLDAPFACNLGACLGACCVHGDRGAPLEPDERQRLEEILPRVRPRLRPEALAVIAEEGVWEGDEDDGYATTTVDNRECVFVVYRGDVAVCAIQDAHNRGAVDWPKPLSCHLYPIRIETIAGTDVLNYERIDLCRPAIPHGQRTGTVLPDFLEVPLTRKYGASWYARFRAACAERLEQIRPAARP